MKRTGNLINQIADLENLRLAFYKAQKGKWHKKEVLNYSKNLENNLWLLHRQILSGNIEVGNYYFFTIYDPKEREICAAYFPERVLHHAIMNVCHQYIDNRLIYDTYATRLNKGTYKALERARYFTRRNQYYLKFDIKKYFDSINHSILKTILSRYFKDNKLLSIFSKIIDSYHTRLGYGLPIGNLASQYFANMYLGELDNYIKHTLRIKYYIRYMDDFVIWTNSKSDLHFFGKKIQQFTEEKLNLKLKTYFSNNVKHGLNFLSYRIFPNKMVLSSKAKRRFRKKLTIYNSLLNKHIISQEEYSLHVRAYTSFAEKAYSKQFRNLIFHNTKTGGNTHNNKRFI